MEDYFDEVFRNAEEAFTKGVNDSADPIDDALKNGIHGVKDKALIKRLSEYNPADGQQLVVREKKGYIPGQGIVHAKYVDEKHQNCGHSFSLGLGHVCNEGHTVCISCVESRIYECASCNRRLCTVIGCDYCAYEFNGVYFCWRDYSHSFWGSLFASLFGGKAYEQKVLEEQEKYQGRRLHLRNSGNAQLPGPKGMHIPEQKKQMWDR